MSKDHNQAPLKDAINKFMEVYKLDRKYNLVEVKNAWKVIMGEYINGKTHSLFMSGTVLRVKLHSSVIKEEILYAKTQVMKDLNEQIGRDLIEEIIFVD
jgi:hypothetical protein